MGKQSSEEQQKKALKLINSNLEQIRQLYAKCEQIAEEHNVLFHHHTPVGDTYCRYYPEMYDEEEIPKHYRGQWITSSDDCS